ncbi:MAG TPA: glycosyltransferase family 39 protein, partial [Pyrinomonadaceae bacterium]|nr:glycosyltransferase family 39 protein [Pyrinomonadaceae bacterium]
NAETIARTGADEHGTPWPLFFRAFGDYKNPTYVYLLAAVFRLTGPSVTVARLLSATLGVVAALLLGLLAWRMTRSTEAAAVVACSALLTPWLYECSRLAFEVSAYPLTVALFLLALWRAESEVRWRPSDVLVLAATLALLTYTYSTGRLLGPLLAAGLALFITRRNVARVALTWGLYALALAPLLVYSRRNPGALTARFKLLTYAAPQTTLASDALGFARHYLADINPWRWLVAGESNIRDHVAGAGALLAATFLLAAFGLVLILRDRGRAPSRRTGHDARRHLRRGAWWLFIVYALAASVVPAALTATDFPQLRLAAFPVFLHVLTMPALVWLLDGGQDFTPASISDAASHSTSSDAALHSTSTRVARINQHARRTHAYKRAALYALVALLLVQGASFQWLFHRRAPERWYVFDARFPRKILAPALAFGRTPIYLYDPPGRSGYIQALWHGTLAGVGPSRFVRLAPSQAPPPGALVISTEDDCSNCRLLARHINYLLYAVLPTDLKPTAAPLPAQAARASITSSELPRELECGQRRALSVVVRNVGGAAWPAVGEEGGRYAVVLRDRWLRADGSTFKDEDGAARMPYDLEPGDTAGVTFQVSAPEAPGDYLLELDVAQEGVGRFGARGSKTLRACVRVYAPG